MEVPTAVITVLPIVQWAIIVALLLISGIAWSFNLWIIPIIKLNGSSSAIAQFEETSYRGGLWLEPFNASIMATCGVTSIILSQHSNPAEATLWKFWAAACVTLVQVAWWERVMIFPLDRAATAMKKNEDHFKGHEKAWLQDRSRVEFHRILDRWTRRHAVRATLPIVAALIALSSKVLT